MKQAHQCLVSEGRPKRERQLEGDSELFSDVGYDVFVL
jgi:hypothetical protein